VKLVDEGGLVRVEYVAPPAPVKAELKDGEIAIDIAEMKGQPTTILTYENGITAHLYREAHDWGAAERYAEAISIWLRDYPDGAFLGLPPAAMKDDPIWLPRHTLLRMLNLHDNVSTSPLAEERVGRKGGSRIVVPGTTIPMHGQGKRR
jgi:hypothetical protein